MRESKYEEIIKRSDGSRVRITVELNTMRLVEYSIKIQHCLPRNESGVFAITPNAGTIEN